MKRKQSSKNISIVPDENIMGKIYYIRGEKVMFDRDLANLYGVETGALNQAMKRNMKRFPEDFMFKLTKEEASNWKSQLVTSNYERSLISQTVISKRGGTRHFPYVFTEQGVAMLSSVLKSERAIEVNIQIMRMFIRTREFLASNSELRAKVEILEKKYDNKFKIVFDAIKSIIEMKKEDIKSTGRIGFKVEK